MTDSPTTATVFLLGPLVGLSGGDVHALRFVDEWERARPGSIDLVTPGSMRRHLTPRAEAALRSLNSPLDDRLLPMPLYMLNLLARTAGALVRAPRADVVVAASHFFHDAIPCAIRARLHGSRVVAYAYHLVEDERRPAGLRSRVSIVLERLSIRVLRGAGALVLVDNPGTATSLVERGFPAADIVTTENAYDPVEPLPPRSPAATPTVVFCGRLTEEKGVWDAVALARALPSARVVMLGDGPLRDALTRRVRELALPNLELRGFVSEDQKWRALRSAWAFIAPSREEGWGIAVGEALTAGLPVIAYDLPAYEHFGDRLQRVPVAELDAFIGAVRGALGETSGSGGSDEAAGLPSWSAILRRERQAIEARAAG